MILKKWRVPIATVVAVAFITGVFMFAKSVSSPPAVQASAEAALLQAIATRDSDNDGLPDWEESLYGTDSHIKDTFKLGMNDGEAVAKGLIVPKAIANVAVSTSTPISYSADGLPPPPPAGSLTDAFIQHFLSLYLVAKDSNNGADLTQKQIDDIATQAVSSLSAIAVVSPDYKSAKDLKVSGSGADALKTFAASAEAVLLKNKTNARDSEINYLKKAIDNSDATALPYIASIAKTYRESTVGLAALSVPTELASANLKLVNAMMRISEITEDFTKLNEDPLVTIAALEQYPQAAKALWTAFENIGKIYKDAGVSFAVDEKGAKFVNMVANIMAKQKTVQKP